MRSTTLNSPNNMFHTTYDPAGNLTNDGVHSYGYNSANQIFSLDGGAYFYAYDEQNRRLKKFNNSTGEWVHYVWEGDHVIAEYDQNGSLLAEYVYSGSRMIAKIAAGSTQYFLSDRLSIRVSLDSGGNVIGRQGHLPFGADFAESGTQEKHHFTSYERDSESGLDYAVNRSLNPSVGRFQSCDPYSCINTFASPPKLNRYTYTSNEPISRIDPLGLVEVCRSHEEFICNRSDYGPGGWECGWETVVECQEINPPRREGEPQRRCPVEPLTPIRDPDAQSFEQDANRVDLEHLTADMRTAVGCFRAAVEARGGYLQRNLGVEAGKLSTASEGGLGQVAGSPEQQQSRMP